MKILTKYVLREHLGPFTFALAALTSLMLLNFISRQFGELVGKGLPWSVIGEFFLLSIPFTVALTVPMSVLVAVLYAFSRLAAENEVTALKASGVSPWRLVGPAIGGGVVMSILLLAFNDQVLPRANHQLKSLQDDISQTKPTFVLKDQVINPISEGKFYLKAGKIDRSGESGRMKEVVIYDLADPTRRRTIYADSGRIALAPNRKDLDLDLYHGQMQEVATDKPAQLDRLFFDHDRVRFPDVASPSFEKTNADSTAKGDREMSVCEMQRRLYTADVMYQDALREYQDVEKGLRQADAEPLRTMAPTPPAARRSEPHGLGWAYCQLIRTVFGVKEAHAGTLPPHQQGQGPARKGAFTPATPPAGSTATSPAAKRDVRRPAPAAGAPMNSAELQQDRGGPPESDPSLRKARLAEAKLRLDMQERNRNRFLIEIHKKFSLAAACLIFVILGAPIAVRFPRGGVGLVLGVSLLVFALYYVGLIGGEALANNGYLPPFWAMWGTNVILTAIGLVLLFRMGREAGSGRGGDWSDIWDAIRARFGRGPRAGERGTA
ncbi:MAG TPA: LptF/LptG family permease [Gemmatimonadaceae bacterium]